MRKIITFLLCAFIGMAANARQITERQALQVAAKYADIDVKSNPYRMKTAGKQQETAAYYAFNIGNNEGFVIVSGDDSLTELVGYSDSGCFDPENMPDNMRSWLQAYSGYVASVQVSESKAKRQRLSEVTTVTVRPFLSTKWNQNEPFNRLVPVLQGNTHCATGCVATAMSQIMKYYEWPEQAEGSYSYTDVYGHKLSADFSQSVYDWDNMLDEYSMYYDSGNNLVAEYDDNQAAAVAKLMLDCGISVGMNYNAVSGASSAAISHAFTAYFGYDSETFFRDNISSGEFMKVLLEELDGMRPVLICGEGLGGAHAFVADGYDSNNFVHINWGWGGYSDGYFNINYLDPEGLGTGGGSGAYQWKQTLTIASPDSEGAHQEREQLRLAYMSGGNYVTGVSMDAESFSQNRTQAVLLGGVYNINGVAFNGEFGVGAFGSEGGMSVIHTAPITISNDEFVSGAYVTDPLSVYVSLRGLPDGDYEIRGISKEYSDEYDYDWVAFDSDLCLKIKIEGGTVTTFPVEQQLSLAEQIGIPEKIYMNSTVEFTATVHNNSSVAADGMINYEVVRRSDNYRLYSESVKAIVYDNNDYAAALSVPVQNGTFDYSEEYVIRIVDFTLLSGEAIPVETEFGQCVFSIDEGVAQRQLSFYEGGSVDNSGISLNLKDFENKDFISKGTRVFVTYTNLMNSYQTDWEGSISCALCGADGEIIGYSDRYADMKLYANTVNINPTDVSISPDLSGLADGLYSIIPVSKEYGATEWVRFDHPAKIDIDIKGDYAYIRNYDYSISQESEISHSGELLSGETVVFSVQMRNNSDEEAVGDLSYEVRRQSDNVIVAEGAERVDLQAYSTSSVMIELNLSENHFTKGVYTIAVTGYQSATHSDFEFVSAYNPYQFSIGVSGVESVDADDVAIYPNPAEDYVTVECDGAICSVDIFSAGGQLVKSLSGTDASVGIYVGNLPSGYYVIAIKTDDGKTVRKQMLKQ